MKKREISQDAEGAAKKKKPHGCLTAFAVIMVLGLIGSCFGGGSSDQKAPQTGGSETSAAGLLPETETVEAETAGTETAETETAETAAVDEAVKQAGLDADTQLYQIILNAESNYQALQSLMANEAATDLDLYDTAKAVESRLREAWSAAGKVNGENIKEYRSATQNYIINMQIIAADIKKYIEKPDVKTLSEAKESMANNQAYIFNVLSERISYLTSCGFTDEEAMNIISPSEEETAGAE